MATANSAKLVCEAIRVVGNTADPFQIEMVEEDGTFTDLAGATATFSLRLSDVTTPFKVEDATCTIDGARVSYAPAAVDVDTPGVFWGRFKIVLADATEYVTRAIEYTIVADI